jgi:hypothetical protein
MKTILGKLNLLFVPTKFELVIQDCQRTRLDRAAEQLLVPEATGDYADARFTAGNLACSLRVLRGRFSCSWHSPRPV